MTQLNATALVVSCVGNEMCRKRGADAGVAAHQLGRKSVTPSGWLTVWPQPAGVNDEETGSGAAST